MLLKFHRSIRQHACFFIDSKDSWCGHVLYVKKKNILKQDLFENLDILFHETVWINIIYNNQFAMQQLPYMATVQSQIESQIV